MQKKKVRNWKSIFGTLAVIVAFGTIITACVFSIVTKANEEQMADNAFNRIAESVEIPNPLVISEDGDEDTEIENMAAGNESVYYQPHSVAELLEINSECIGWVSIDGTNISYPVMHTPSNPEKYLYKDFYGNYSNSGTPFLDARCSESDDNLIVYGHHMNGGTMFAALCNYTSKCYRDSHPNVVLETRNGASLYRVFAVMKIKSTDYWYNFLTAETERKYDTKISYALKNSLYNTGITPKYGQQILTLSTCYGSAKDDRIVVLAVKG